MRIEEKAKLQAQKQGWKLIDFIEFPHPDDSYMIITLVEYNECGKKMFATHLFNDSLSDSGSFNNGHYEMGSLDVAVKQMQGRI